MVVTLVVDQAARLKLQVITKAVATPAVVVILAVTLAVAQVVAVVLPLAALRIPLQAQVKGPVVQVMDLVQAKALVKV